jgi:hypothetical protein
MYMATKEDIERAKKIILDTINKKIILDSKELLELAEKVLNISYSIGGGYDESTIRQIAQVKIKEWFNI